MKTTEMNVTSNFDYLCDLERVDLTALVMMMNLNVGIKLFKMDSRKTTKLLVALEGKGTLFYPCLAKVVLISVTRPS